MRKLSIFLLIIFLIYGGIAACKSPPEVLPIPITLPPPPPPPPPPVKPALKVLKPEFIVTSIYIIQADIVVTEFEAVIKVINPNEFAMELSSIAYELFGSGRYWSGGSANDVMEIPANSSSETSFKFSMNFIDMDRRLLDDVIAMRRINYQFTGKAQVRPVILDVLAFLVDFNCTGLSEVKPK